MELPPLVLINAVGLTRRLLAHAPRLQALAESGWRRPLREVVPAVTCTAQASLLTGQPPDGHGIVGNGWLFRETGEVRFWQQSNALIQAEPIYVTARRLAARAGPDVPRGQAVLVVQPGGGGRFSVTPKPHYGADGNKVFGITGTPDGLCRAARTRARPVPVPHLLGPVRRAALHRLDRPMRRRRCSTRERPDLTLVYLPHLDYDPQRFGPSGCDMPRLVGELDDACAPLLDAARPVGARVWVVSEYGHCDVTPAGPASTASCARRAARRPAGPVRRDPRHLRRAAPSPSATISWPTSTSRDPTTAPRVRDLLGREPGVARVLAGEERARDRPRPSAVGRARRPVRARRLVRLSLLARRPPGPRLRPDGRHPPQARLRPLRAVLRPEARSGPRAGRSRRLVQKKLGFRTLFDVIPLDPALVRGSHGLRASRAEDRPILIGDGPPPTARRPSSMTDVHGLLLHALGLDDPG